MSLRRLSLACQVVMCVSCESHVSTHVKDKVVGASPGRERGTIRAPAASSLCLSDPTVTVP